ncbi:hypothetical protein Gasu2_43670 [Galdieria sulphuraria]|nr:hypothetical protein Gasu2_43670 [Galdieria sulphuraria]
MTEDFGYFSFLEKTAMEPTTDGFLSLDEPGLAYAGSELGKQQDRSIFGRFFDLRETIKNEEGTTLLLSGHPHIVVDSLLGENELRAVDSAVWTQQKTNNWKEWNADLLKAPEEFASRANATETVDFLSTVIPKEELATIEDGNSDRMDGVGRLEGLQWDCHSTYRKHNEDWRLKGVDHSCEGRPVSEEEILEEARKKYSILRKSDGSRYKENQIRAVKGSLCSTGIFMKAEENGKEWVVNEEAAKQYEAKMLQKHGNLSRKWHSWNTRRGFLKKTKKLGIDYTGEDGVTMEGQWMIPKCCSCCFDCCSCCREEGIETVSCSQWSWLMSISNDMRKDPRWNDCFENPFRGCKINCNLKELEDSLGTEKLKHVMQTFHWLRDWFMCNDSKQSLDRMYPTSPIKTNRKTNHFVSSSVDQPFSTFKYDKSRFHCPSRRMFQEYGYLEEKMPF